MIIEDPEIILPRHLPMEVTGKENNLSVDNGFDQKQDIKIPNEGMDLQSFTNSVHIKIIKKALHMSNGSKSKAAKLLNMDRFALRYLMKKLQIE
jgi:DNA-binding NtrC family response regulator